MAEIKNTFLRSKMNKDLDDRIIPNGEYRDAHNISVGRSEDNDVGALENIIGNNLVTGTDIGDGLTIIGIENNNTTGQLFVFLTDYTDPNPSQPTNAPANSRHYIYSYNENTNQYSLLVEGEFLNFSTTDRIIGINLIENLLFWTDNRNQPRKININFAGRNVGVGKSNAPQVYYTQEHQISVAKYSPYQAIELYTRVELQIETAVQGYFRVAGDQTIALTPFIGATVVSPEGSIDGNDFIKVESVTFVGGSTRIFVTPNFTTIPVDDSYVILLLSTMANKDDDSEWAGDPNYLEDKFVRFSYRFKFDDNEYSLMAPFTQIAYIPKQYGFWLAGDEDAAYQSTIVSFMENLVQNVGLIIPLPTSANRIVRDYKISELEILFRESDGVAVRVLESITAGEISGASGLDNSYTYDYQSRKPYRTLPEIQTTRVYDKVPVRAFAQETSGNRIIYGNYRDHHTPPANLNYNCRIAPKSSTGKYNNWIEYPNHSVKRNRNYQIGFVLADKFGRQSPVILSSVDVGVTSGGQFYSGSTIYSPYDIVAEDTDVKTWFGDTIQVIVNSPITSTKNNNTGTPGLYAVRQQEINANGIGYAVMISGNTITDTTYTFRLDDGALQYPNNINIPREGDYLRGNYEDFVKVLSITGPSGGGQTYTVTTTGRVSDIYFRAENLPVNTPDLKFAYTINDLGWYSYKIVVKQTQQEYYNVYLPGILNGYPGQSGGLNEGPDPNINWPGGIDTGLFPTNETDRTAFTTLFNDNINKIPRDLNEIGPDQKQYRSSVTLFGRVTNTMTTVASNAQYYARLSYTGKNAVAHTSTAISRAEDVNMGYADLSLGEGSDGTVSDMNTMLQVNTGAGYGNKVFYQLDTNPLVARLSTTDKQIGASALLYTNLVAGPPGPANNSPSTLTNMLPFLAVYETAPTESRLDIYWETTTEGLIVDLNADVASGSGGVAGFRDFVWDFSENDPTGTYVTETFLPINEEGQDYVVRVGAELISQRNADGVVELFELIQQPAGGSNFNDLRLRYIGPGEVFLTGDNILDVYTFEIEMTTQDGFIDIITVGGQIQGEGALKNIVPEMPEIGGANHSISGITKDTIILIPEADWIGQVNGTILDDGSELEGLVHTMEKIAPGDAGGGNAMAPDHWTMDSVSGQVTQGTPNTTGQTTPNGTYGLKLILTDADNNAGTGAYGPLFVTQFVTITLGYARVNPEVITDNCILTPDTNMNKVLYNIEHQWTVSNNVWTGNNQWYSTTGVWFILKAGGDQNISQLNIVEDTNLTSTNGQPVFPPDYPPAGDNPNKYNDTMVFAENGSTPGGHTSGTLAITMNGYQFQDNLPGFTAEFSWKSAKYYYRIEGDGLNNWTEIPRSLEYNNAGLVDSTASPTFDFPFYMDSGWSVGVLGVGAPIWFQTVRAFDYADFDTSQEIEYAVVVTNFRQMKGPGASQIDKRAIAWLIADDLHYPGCVPWQGQNAATVNGNDPSQNIFNSFEYFRTDGTNTKGEYVNIDTNTAPVVYAETPYGEYINQFYTNTARTEPYLPINDGANPYINYRLDRIPLGLAKWTDTIGTTIDLQWSAGYSSEDGNRISEPDENIGVNSIQTTQNIPTTNDPEINTYAGTSRMVIQN